MRRSRAVTAHAVTAHAVTAHAVTALAATRPARRAALPVALPLALAAALIAAPLRDAAAQEPSGQPISETVRCDDRDNEYCTEIARIAQRPDVVRAMRFIERQNEVARRELIMLTEIPAPPFAEERRAAAYADMLREAGADSVWTDSIGNVIALRRGAGADGRTVAMAGHLDTVFPEGTDVTVRERGDTLYAPGIGDDTRGLIVILHVLRALVEADIRADADLWFIGTVGEEGLGDLRGVKHLFRDGAHPIDAFIAVDGGSDAGITNGALGSRRYRVTVEGPGGHSWGAFGTANPVHALGRAILMFDTVAARFTAEGERTSYNVGRIGGGTSVNSVPFEAWAEVDMRSHSQARLQAIDSIFRDVMPRAVAQQNETRRRGEELRLKLELVGDRPSGETARGTPLLERAMAVTRWFGEEPRLSTSSTDANTPIAAGVPALTIGRGGVGGETHAPGEWWLDVDAYRAVHRALVLMLAEAGLR